MANEYDFLAYGIDVDQLDEGETIDAETCEALLSCTRDQASYGRAMQALCEHIRRALWERGVQAVVCQRDYGVRVLRRDGEAVQYADSRWEKGRRWMHTSVHELKVCVDPKRLKKEDREQYEHKLHARSRAMLELEYHEALGNLEGSVEITTKTSK